MLQQGPTHHPQNGGGGEAAAPAAPSLRQVCLELQDKVEAFLAEDVETKLLRGVQAQVREAVSVIDEALDKYSLEELSLSYNGGKDCLVLLILILACLPRHFEPTPPPSTTTPSALSFGPPRHSNPPTNTPLSATPRAATPTNAFPTSLQSVYIVSPHPFAEVDTFVNASAAAYHLDLCRYALPMRAALDAYLAERPRLRAIFVGTRRTDPHGADLRHFDPTDDGWPAFMRVHPVIDWHYAEIWAFIRHLNIPYLSLYDKGYTSLGGTEDTHPNPHLKKEDGARGFKPAYELTEDNEERLGRDW
ncbi:adenine nucleotide alpha hydrolases-like protein [Cryphonectria parasitica EP155]|uniref:FAD synthase n=1 Tax=Cryphonectria parasitica (strain ATCC 38755 / EP155) TaxID=660469 RepID=A0A9P5CR81_CRYP1|nr:adenine nucleotide alpha hydrolases-like protein [Cryphonectria parasitica EP155]KAF3767001.1 adenine nucleotide alpha hydrolases-like protein [Cryphonectria parasitica EP155]